MTDTTPYWRNLEHDDEAQAALREVGLTAAPQWDDDYLDALSEALDRRRTERIREAGKKAMDARLAAFDAQHAADEAERKYRQLGGTGL